MHWCVDLFSSQAPQVQGFPIRSQDDSRFSFLPLNKTVNFNYWQRIQEILNNTKVKEFDIILESVVDFVIAIDPPSICIQQYQSYFFV